MKDFKESLLYKRVKNWWALLIIGIVSLVVGIWCMFTPISTFLALTMVFVVSFFFFGMMEVIFAISNKDSMRSWGWRFAMGIIDILFGVLLISNLGMTAEVLCFFVAFWLMFKAIGGIASSIELQKIPNSDWGWMLALSILLLLGSFFLISNPVAAAAFVVYIVSFSFVVYGVLAIYLSFKMKNIKNDYIEIKNKLKSDD